MPVRIEVVDSTSPVARWAVGQYLAELDARFPSGFDPQDGPSEGPATFDPPQGVFLVVFEDEEPVGCGAIRLLDEGRAEVKRMWIDPTVRGRGLGALLLARLEDESRRFGCSRVVLDTNAGLTEAVAMYRRNGYADVPPYNANPYAELWFEKVIVPD